jgi:hypothetical protein
LIQKFIGHDPEPNSIQIQGLLKMFVTIFYGEKLLIPYPTPNLDDHPLTPMIVYSILFTAALYI